MSHIPATISAGLSLRIVVSVPAFPAPSWSVSLLARGAGAIDLKSTESGGPAHLLAASAEQTGAWTPGRYHYQVRATDGAEVVQLEDGLLEIAPDLAAAEAGLDVRDHVDRVLEAIEAVIEGRASTDQQSYRINNRSLDRTPIADLLQLRETYRRQKAKRDAGRRGNGMLGRRLLVRF